MKKLQALVKNKNTYYYIIIITVVTINFIITKTNEKFKLVKSAKFK